MIPAGASPGSHRLLDVCDDPIFVVGSPGCGTAGLFEALVAHPRLWGGGTGEFLTRMIDGIDDAYEAGSAQGRLHWLPGQYVGRDEFLEHIGRGINALYAARAGGRRWVDHSPVYARYLDRLTAMFPTARFLFVIRDGRVAVEAMVADIEGLRRDAATHIWGRYAQACRRGLQRYPDRLRVVRHEDLMADPVVEMEGVLAFLGEASDPSPVQALARAPAVAPPGWERWQPGQQAAFQAQVGGLLVALGFTADDSWVGTTVPT